jgi:NAD(P)-dependent dehydrogenase (short-subunit alcohol dehydrogenase family)
MPKLEGKIAVVTGGSAGIGLATAKRFAAEGARVFITGRRQAALDAAVGDIGPGTTAVRADSANLADLDRLYARVAEGAGRIDILFANAGGGTVAPLGAITPEHYEEIFGSNVKGTLFTVQKALPLLSDGASVILAGSIMGSMGTAGCSVYSAAKAAIRNFARSWTLDLKHRRVRVNVLSPGATRTPGLLHAFAGSDADKQQKFADRVAAGIPLGRMAEADDIARVAVFLASEDSNFIAGAELFADGGTRQV